MNRALKVITPPQTRNTTTAGVPARAAELSPQEITNAIVAIEKEWIAARQRLHNHACRGGSRCFSRGEWTDWDHIVHYDEQGRAWFKVRSCFWNRNSTSAQAIDAQYAQQIAALTDPPPPLNPVAQAVEEGRRQGADLFSQMLTAQEFERIMNRALDGLEEGSDLYERTRNLFERHLEQMMEDDQ